MNTVVSRAVSLGKGAIHLFSQHSNHFQSDRACLALQTAIDQHDCEPDDWKPGAKMCKFTARVVVKNKGKKDIVASKKTSKFTFTDPKGKAITSPPLGNDTPEIFADAVPMKPGESKTYMVKFHTNGAAVEPGKPYKLKVAAYDTSDERKVVFVKP